MHAVVIIVNVALLSLPSVITLLEMLLWGAAPALYHLAAEGKAPLILPSQISFPGSCAQAQAVLCQALPARPDLQFAGDCSTSHSPAVGCQGLLNILFGLHLSDTSVLFRLGTQPHLCAPPVPEQRDFCPNKWKSLPS